MSESTEVREARKRRERGEHLKPDHCACGHTRKQHARTIYVGHGDYCYLCPCTDYSEGG